MWRILIYIAVLCLAALGAVWISDLSGEVTISLMGMTASPSLPVAVTLLLAGGLLIALAWGLIAFLLRLPFRIGRSAKTRRRAKGYQALSRGMIAVGAGDTSKALRHARDAERLLGEEPMTLLLNAQVAQVTGDLAHADSAFRKMTTHGETRLLGLRGLFIEARRQGNHETAYRHAREAAQLAPAAGWANEAVLEAHCAEGAWVDALDMIDKRAAFGLIDKETAKRQRAVLLTANALSHEHNAPETALHDVLRALKFAPTLVPAAALAGRLLRQRNDVRKAAKILEKAWAATPHPDLADGYIHLRLGDSTQDRLKRAETLGKLASWHPEARLAVAMAALDAREFKRARDVLAPLLSDRPSIRTCLLMADIEEAEHGAVGHVREWVARAARAPRDPAWIADGLVSDHWLPFSPATGHIDAFRWQTPPDTLALPDLPAFDLDMTAEEQGKNPAPQITATVVEAEPVTVEEKSEETPAKAEPTPTVVAELVADKSEPAPPDVAPEASIETVHPAKPSQPAKKPVVQPQPVVFPIQRAPDDPGIDEKREKARKR